MHSSINLYSTKSNEINNFLNKYYNSLDIKETKRWMKEFPNPIDMADIIGVFLENSDKYNINMWISIDPGIFINITENNGDKIIRYLFERYPY